MLSKYLSPTNANVVVLEKCKLASTNNALPEDGMNAPKHVGAILM